MAPPPASIAQMTEQFTASPLSALPQAARLGVWQTTVANEVALSGIGLHSGRQVNLRLLPAPANTSRWAASEVTASRCGSLRPVKISVISIELRTPNESKPRRIAD